MPKGRDPVSRGPSGRPRGLLLLGVVALLGALAMSSLFVSASTPVEGTPSSVPPSIAAPSAPAEGRTLDAASAAPLPNVTATQPLTGWETPRGDVDLNGTADSFAPEAPTPGAAPPTMARAYLGPNGTRSLGFVVAPNGGPVVAGLANATACAWNSTTLLELWCATAASPLSTAPVISGAQAVEVAGEDVYAWNLSGGARAWWTSLGSPSRGAFPTPYDGSLFILTSSALVVLNASTGTNVSWSPLDGVDPTHALAVGDGGLYGQDASGTAQVVGFSPFGVWTRDLPDGISTGGATLYSDGLFAVAGSSGAVNGGIGGTTGWYAPTLGSSLPLAPLAASNDRLFATNGSGPLVAFEEDHGAELWRTPSWVSSAPTLAGDEVLVGVNASVAALDPDSGAPLWSVPVPGSVTLSPEVAGGLLFVLDGSGNLSSFGEAPLAVHVMPSGTRVPAGDPIDFSAFVTGGAGEGSSVSWRFSDGGSLNGNDVSQAFSTPGMAWAQASAEDNQGVVTDPAVVTFTILPAFTVALGLSARSGNAPLWVNATALPEGGNGSWASIGFQVTGVDAGWYPATSSSVTLTLDSSGTAFVTAWVNDTAGNTATSSTEEVVVQPANPAAPHVVLTPTGPGSVEVTWSAPAVPGFQAWWVNATVDGTAFGPSQELTSPSTDAYDLTGLPMDADLSVRVGEANSYGPTNASGGASITTPLYAPTLTASAAPTLPGQALLSWTLPATVDHFRNWTLWETSPGSVVPRGFTLPANVTATSVSYTTGVLTNLNTTTFALEIGTTDGANATSASVAYATTFAPPTLEVATASLEVSVRWSPITDLSDFADVKVCYEPDASPGSVTCPVTSPSPDPTAPVSFSLPAAGSYDVNVTVEAANGFTVLSGGVSVVATAPSAAPAWYATVLAGVAFWVWGLLGLFLLVLVLLAWVVYRERTGIPPYGKEVLPWDPLEPDLEPHAKPTGPEPLADEPRLHRHRSSHSHRHLRRHADEDSSDEEAASPGSLAAVASGGGAASTDGAPQGTEDETPEPSLRTPSRPSKRSNSEGPAKIDTVGEEPSGSPPADEEEPAPGELQKLPVVLRHKEAPEEEATPEPKSPTPRRAPPTKPSASKNPPSKGAAEKEEDEEDDAEPRRPAKPRPAEPEEPTL